MRDLPSDKLNTVVEAFRIIELLSETIFEAVVSNGDLDPATAHTLSEDAAIISNRMKAAVSILDAQYPGLRELIVLSDKRAVKRAAEIIAKQLADQPRH